MKNNLSIKITTNKDRIREIFTNDTIYEAMKTSEYPDKDNFIPAVTEDTKWFIVKYQNKDVGIIFFHKTGFGRWEIHLGFLPEIHRKGIAFTAGKKAIKWMFNEYLANLIYSPIKPERKDVLNLARKAGFRLLDIAYIDKELRYVMGVTK